MALNMDLVIGGETAARIPPYWGDLCVRMAVYDRFARDIDYIRLCTQRENACAIGAGEVREPAIGWITGKAAGKRPPLLFCS